MTLQSVEEHCLYLRLGLAEELLGGLPEEDRLPHHLELGDSSDGDGDPQLGVDGGREHLQSHHVQRQPLHRVERCEYYLVPLPGAEFTS